MTDDDPLSRLAEAVEYFREQSELFESRGAPGEPPQAVPLSALIRYGSSVVRVWLDLMASSLQAEAVEVKQQFRQARAEYQKESRKNRAWTHDVRVKNTPNGAYVEWLRYKKRYGDASFSEGIRSEGRKKIPARSFKPCSAIEKSAISSAEDEFFPLRQATHWFSTMAGALNALSQMRFFDTPQDVMPSYDPLDCRFGCSCPEPCNEYLDSLNMAWG